MAEEASGPLTGLWVVVFVLSNLYAACFLAVAYFNAHPEQLLRARRSLRHLSGRRKRSASASTLYRQPSAATTDSSLFDVPISNGSESGPSHSNHYQQPLGRSTETSMSTFCSADDIGSFLPSLPGGGTPGGGGADEEGAGGASGGADADKPTGARQQWVPAVQPVALEWRALSLRVTGVTTAIKSILQVGVAQCVSGYRLQHKPCLPD